MIGGFELPSGGTILLRGRDVTADPPDKRPVNMVFQNYALFPHLDVGDNVAFGLKRKGVAKDETARRVGEALELVHLDRLRTPQAEPAVGRPAAAGRPRPGAGQPAQRAAPRRAARRTRPQAAAPAPGRAQAHPGRGRDHLRVRDPRSGGGAHDERPDRGDARRQGRAARDAGRALRAPGDPIRRRLHRLDQPAARTDRSRRQGPPRIGRGRPRRARRHARRQRGRDQRPTGGDLDRPGQRRGRHQGDGRTGRLSRDHHLLPTSHGGRTRPDRAVTKDRGQAASRQRCGRHLVTVRGAYPRRRPGAGQRRNHREGSARHLRQGHRERPRTLPDRAAHDPPRAHRADRRPRGGRRARADRGRMRERRGIAVRGAVGRSAVRGPQRIRGRRDRHARADAGPVARVRADRLQLARLHRRGRHPLVRGEVPGQGQVRAVRRHRGRLRQARPGRGRLRHLVPDLGRRAAFRRGRHAHRARPVAPAEPRQPRSPVDRPWLRPGQQAFGSVCLVDDRRRLRLDEGDRQPDQLEGPLGSRATRATSR